MTSFKQRTIPSKLRSFTSIFPSAKSAGTFPFFHNSLSVTVFLSLFIPFEFGIAGSMAILWNFHPFGRRSQKNATDTVSPFQKLNGFSYHPNWLRNFLIASSLNGKGGGNFRKHTIRQN
jgi:hypothetical protein